LFEFIGTTNHYKSSTDLHAQQSLQYMLSLHQSLTGNGSEQWPLLLTSHHLRSNSWLEAKVTVRPAVSRSVCWYCCHISGCKVSVQRDWGSAGAGVPLWWLPWQRALRSCFDYGTYEICDL
jgi:hypothetical protein